MEDVLPVSLGAIGGGHEGSVAGCAGDSGGPTAKAGTDKGGLEDGGEGGRGADGRPEHQLEGCLLKDGCSRELAAACGELQCVCSPSLLVPAHCRPPLSCGRQQWCNTASDVARYRVIWCSHLECLPLELSVLHPSRCLSSGVNTTGGAGRHAPAVLPGGGVAKGLHPQVRSDCLLCSVWWVGHCLVSYDGPAGLSSLKPEWQR